MKRIHFRKGKEREREKKWGEREFFLWTKHVLWNYALTDLDDNALMVNFKIAVVPCNRPFCC
jgi:hypothetical protein